MWMRLHFASVENRRLSISSLEYKRTFGMEGNRCHAEGFFDRSLQSIPEWNFVKKSRFSSFCRIYEFDESIRRDSPINSIHTPLQWTPYLLWQGLVVVGGGEPECYEILQENYNQSSMCFPRRKIFTKKLVNIIGNKNQISELSNKADFSSNVITTIIKWLNNTSTSGLKPFWYANNIHHRCSWFAECHWAKQRPLVPFACWFEIF